VWCDAAVDYSHVVRVDVATSVRAVDVLEADAEMSTGALSVTQVSVERTLDGAVSSRGTRMTELARLTSVQFMDDSDQPCAAVERYIAAVAAVPRQICCSHITLHYITDF